MPKLSPKVPADASAFSGLVPMSGSMGAHDDLPWIAQELALIRDADARDWWWPYAGRTLETFQWHGDTFVPPAGAQQLASAPHRAHQVFVLGGRHLLVQSHLEMTPELVEGYLTHNGAQLEQQVRAGNPAASAVEDARRDLAGRTAGMTDVLRQLYGRWGRGLG